MSEVSIPQEMVERKARPVDESFGIISNDSWRKGSNELKTRAADRDVSLFPLAADMKTLAPAAFSEPVIARPFLERRAAEILVPAIEGKADLSKMQAYDMRVGDAFDAERRLSLLASGKILFGDSLPVRQDTQEKLIKEVLKRRTSNRINQSLIPQYAADIANLALIDPNLLQRADVAQLRDLMKAIAVGHFSQIKNSMNSYINPDKGITEAGDFSIVYPELQEQYLLSSQQHESVQQRIREDFNSINPAGDPRHITQNRLSVSYHTASRLKYLVSPHTVQRNMISFYPPSEEVLVSPSIIDFNA